MFTRLHGISFGRFGHDEASHFAYYRPFGPCSVYALLAMFELMHLYYLWLFWPRSSRCIYVVFGRLGHVQGAAF